MEEHRLSGYALVLSKKFPNRVWKILGNSYDSLEFIDNGPVIEKNELDDLLAICENELAAEIEEAENKKQAIVDARQSAIAKLEALGLTVDEVQAAFGLGA